MSGITGNSDCEECLSSAHVANISTELHPHDDDDELLRYIWREYLHPKQYEWVLIVAYIIVFFVSLIGNSLEGSSCSRSRWRLNL
ncbi:Orexin receptor type 2 [Dissostichus eleginoides]|nr:Orexin receptor type 2 [Dissostichus eleginoides]